MDITYKVVWKEGETALFIDGSSRKYAAKNGNLAWRINNPGLVKHHCRLARKNGSIGFRDKYGIHNTDGSTALVFIGKNDIIFYDSHAPYAKQYSDLYQEPYEEALKIVRRKR